MSLNFIVVEASELFNSENSVFYPRHTSKICETKIRAFYQNGIKLSKYRGNAIARNFDWSERGEFDNYELFNLHTLRHLECLISGRSSIDVAKEGVQKWIQMYGDKAEFDKISWREHSTSWRAVVFAYFWTASNRCDDYTDEFCTRFLSVIQNHGSFLSRPSIYRPFHNHGLNNALGLVALGATFKELKEAQIWLELGFSRAEQQMRDNVADSGMHLEQSGFYHLYTFRSFAEIGRVAKEIGRPLSEYFYLKLGKMLEVSGALLNQNGIVTGLSYSDPEEDISSYIAPYISKIVSRASYSKYNYLRSRKDSGLLNISDGGYVIMPASTKDEFRVVMHTNTFDGPHVFKAVGHLYVSINDTPILDNTSSMHAMEEIEGWYAYFSGPKGHNTIYIKGAQRAVPGRRIDGAFATFFDSYKVNNIVNKLGIEDIFTETRRTLGYGRKSLRERVQVGGGEVVSLNETQDVSYVVVKNPTFSGVNYSRLVGKLDKNLLIIYDQVALNEVADVRQIFNFSESASLKNNGVLTLKDGQELFYKQLMPTARRDCFGNMKPDKCGWKISGPSSLQKANAIEYSQNDNVATFVWLLSSRKLGSYQIRESNQHYFLISDGEHAYRIKKLESDLVSGELMVKKL